LALTLDEVLLEGRMCRFDFRSPFYTQFNSLWIGEETHLSPTAIGV
jgi:hypothetical protein